MTLGQRAQCGALYALAAVCVASTAGVGSAEGEPLEPSLSSDPLFRLTDHFDEDIGSSRGVAWGDFDNDGFVDIVVGNTNDQPLFLYRNVAGTGFERIVEGELGAFTGYAEGVAWVDYDNDGWLDLFVATTRGPNLLFRNSGGHFTRVRGSALTDSDINTSMGCWEDFDQDGWLDVFLATRADAPDRIFRNDGGRRFVEVQTIFSELPTDARACAVGDFNGDSLPDIFVGNFLQSSPDGKQRKAVNALYLSGEDGGFEIERSGHAVNNPGLTYGLVAVDFDYDGDVDLFNTAIAMSDDNVLYENIANSMFYPRFDLDLSNRPRGPSKGTSWGDFDLDGHLDVFVAEGTEGLSEADAPYDIANALFLGSKAGFMRIDTGDLVAAMQVSAGVASADFDNDGDLDLLIANWGGSGERNALYENLAQGNWIAFKLVGRRSNRMSAGAMVTVEAASSGGTATQTRFSTLHTGYGSANSNDLHFGLGSATRVKRACARWPSGAVLCLRDLEAHRVYPMVEPQ